MTVKKLLTVDNLRDYQRLIVDHALETPRCGIFAGMGMGKTAATLTTIDALQMAGEDSPTLIVAPLRVAKTVWTTEAQKWQHTKHLKIVPIVGTEKQRLQALKYDAPIATTNYENLMWMTEHFGDKWPYKTVVSDEFSKLKSFRLRQGGQRAAALGKIAHTKIDRFIGLTGTPASCGLQDLWGQVYFLDRGSRLGRTYSAFQQRWFKTNANGFGASPMPHAQEEIQNLIKDLCITVAAEDYFDIKKPLVTTIEIDLPPKVREMYDSMEKEYFLELESGHTVDAPNAAARSMKLLQICSGSCYVESEVDNDAHPKSRAFKILHSEKLDVLDDIIEETGGIPLLVAYQFKSELERLRKKYPEGRWLSDDKEMAEFKSGKFNLGFGHAKSIGHGNDGMQEHCWTIVNLSTGWNLEEHLQLTERVGPVRQLQSGKNRVVNIYNVVARDTIDVAVAERLESKSSIQDTLLAAMKRRKEGT